MLIIKLQTLSDEANPEDPRPAGEDAELNSLQARLDITRSAALLAETGILHLTQIKPRDAPGALYMATRTGKR